MDIAITWFQFVIPPVVSSDILRARDKVNFFTLLMYINALKKSFQVQSLMEIKNKVLEIIKEVCLYKESNLQQHVFKIRDYVREIVKSNYSDVNFGIVAIAEKLGKSPYYISKVYKEETGEGILDYINFIRIE
jgi:YesN/AraC family two-component response regulator